MNGDVRLKFMDVDAERLRLDDATGELRMVVASYGNVDRMNDVMMRGSLEPFPADGEIDVLWNHRKGEIIGEWRDYEVDKDGLVWATARVYKETARGGDLYNLALRNRLKGASIGFIPERYRVSSDPNRRGGEDIEKARLTEISLLTVRPANDRAGGDNISVVKSQPTTDEIILQALERM